MDAATRNCFPSLFICLFYDIIYFLLFIIFLLGFLFLKLQMYIFGFSALIMFGNYVISGFSPRNNNYKFDYIACQLKLHVL
jgi:hypothetical protein